MIVRFGEFEMDTAACRLVRNGTEVPLAKQPFDLLALLVSCAGEVVTRDEIGSALWGESTFVDSEHGINTAVRKIRAALGEEAGGRRYIETVVKRGYRFVAPVTMPEPEQPVDDALPAVRGRRSVKIAAAAMLLAAAVVGAVVERGMIPEPAPELNWKALTGPVQTGTPIASDGRNVYWTEFDASGCRPWQVPIDTGNEGENGAVPVPSPLPRGFVRDANPEGELLLVVPETCRKTEIQNGAGALWALSAVSGRARRIGDLVALDAVWSPGPAESRHIAFARANEIWLARGDGSEARRIATFSGFAENMHWSPDGKLLRFALHRITEFRYPLWEVEVETGKSRPVLPEWTDSSEDFGGAWLPNGQFIFDSRRASGTDLWRMISARWSSTGHRLQQITHGPIEYQAPATIPGRSDLAVVGMRQEGELQRFDSNIHVFVPFLNGISAGMVDFSRDGQWVAYVTYPARDLWRSRIDGSEALQLTHGPLCAGTPHISPDGRTVAFVGDYAGQDLRPWLVPFDGGEPKPASTLAPGTAQVGSSWSPDGRNILIRLDRPGQPHVLQTLDVTSGRTETVPGSENKYHQRWSPDGKWMVATPYGEEALQLFDVERREWKTLTPMFATYPNWSRDSAYIYFCTRFHVGEEAIYKVSVASGEAARVTSLAGIPRAADWVHGQWMGLTPDGSPLILKSAALKQIYLLSFAH